MTISLLCFGLCFLLLPHQLGITSWHLTAFWGWPLLVTESTVQWKSTCVQREKEKVFFALKPAKISKKILLSRRGWHLISKKAAWFQDSVFDLPQLSDCRILDGDVGIVQVQGTAGVCPGLVSRKARSALLGFLVGCCCLHEKCCNQRDSRACFAQNTG